VQDVVFPLPCAQGKRDGDRDGDRQREEEGEGEGDEERGREREGGIEREGGREAGRGEAKSDKIECGMYHAAASYLCDIGCVSAHCMKCPDELTWRPTNMMTLDLPFLGTKGLTGGHSMSQSSSNTACTT